MAGVIQKPETLNLSGNLKSFIIYDTTAAVSFVLKKGADVLLEQSYEPGPDKRIEIDVRDVVEASLSYLVDASRTTYLQTGLVADFTATIDKTDYLFRVIRSGVASLADTAANWLKQHFLTWQPRIKQVTYYSPEWLTYYAAEACALKMKATYPDKSFRTILVHNFQAGAATTINMQYAVVAGRLGFTYPSYYEVWTETPGGAKLSESQMYAFSDVLSEDEQWYLFENSLGGLDTFRAYGTNNLAAEHEHNIAEFGDVREEYQVDTERKYVKNTGHLDEYARRWLLDFFPSKTKYVYEATAIRKIVVSESNATYVSNELPSSYTFTWQLAEVSPYLNLVKNAADIPDTLVAPDLSSPDFILPPRLAEFPRVQLTEGVLIPAFDPHNPKPTVTTFGAMHDTIKNAIVKELEDELANIGSGGGSGGGGGSDIYIIKTNDLTLPTDENVFSALRTLDEIDNLLIEINDMFLRKDIPDTAHEAITFDKKIGSTIFLDGMDGKGWEIKDNGFGLFDSLRVRSDIFIGGKFGSQSFASGFTGWGVEIDIPTASATFDHLTVRKSMKVYELVYSQIYGLGGSVIISDLNKILYVETCQGFYRCYMDSMDGLMRMNLRKDDIVRMQRSSGINIRYFYGEVLAVTPDYFDLKITDGEDYPELGDVVFRFGNKTDKNRQGIIYLTSSDDNAPYIDVLDEITDSSMFEKIKVRLGNFSGIRTKKGVQLKGYGIYAQGAVFENSDIYLQNGITVEQQFIVMEGKFNSTIDGIRNDMSAESGNILRNSSFSINTNYWTADSTIHFINVGNEYLWMDGSFYVDKRSTAGIYRDGSRNVLRVLNSSITQQKDVMNIPVRTDPEEGGYSYSFAFYYKVIKPGTLSVGFEGSELYQEISLSPATGEMLYQKMSKVGKWNETGDFRIKFTGEILIYGISLFNDALADAQIKLQTQIDQTSEYIKLLATKDYVDSETGQIYIHYNSELKITAEQISAISTRVNNINNTIATAGWITTADGNRLFASLSSFNALTGRVSTAETNISNNAYAISLKASTKDVSALDGRVKKAEASIVVNAQSITQKVSSTDYNGQTIVSKVNQTSSSYTIEAKNINLNGVVTANNYFKIKADGSMETIAGKIGGFSLIGYNLRASKNGISVNLDTDGISFSGGKRYGGFGLNSGPATLGVDIPLWINSEGSVNERNYAAYIGASGAVGSNANKALILDGGLDISLGYINKGNNTYQVDTIRLYNVRRDSWENGGSAGVVYSGEVRVAELSGYKYLVLK